MRPNKWIALAALVVLLAGALSASAYGLFRRQYYADSWSSYSGGSYYYRSYYYKPYPEYSGYRYHYCVYYPSRPQYVYYYNPYSQVYWGRYEIGSKEGQQYSHLADKDKKKELEQIAEEAFPKPGPMPTVPDAKDNIQIEPPPTNDLPKK